MKNLFLFVLLLIGINGYGQIQPPEVIDTIQAVDVPNVIHFTEMGKFYKQYIKYCHVKLKDTLIKQESSFLTNDIPLYYTCDDGSKKKIGYKRVVTDTVWERCDSVYYRNDFTGFRYYNSRYIYADSCSTHMGGYYSKHLTQNTLFFDDTKECTPPTRKVKAILKQEKPSEEGFYHWLFKEVKK